MKIITSNSTRTGRKHKKRRKTRNSFPKESVLENAESYDNAHTKTTHKNAILSKEKYIQMK